MNTKTHINTRMFKGFMAFNGDIQSDLAAALGISASRLNAKIKEWNGASFTVPEIEFIKKRYNMTDEEAEQVFFTQKVSKNAT